jgi:hypothetical protein
MEGTYKVKHLVIVTCGRTGSTVLQHALNGVPGVTIRGENDNFCFGLFSSYRSVLQSKKHAGEATDSRHPYFGAEQIDIDQIRAAFLSVILDILSPDETASDPGILGFKEVKFFVVRPDLVEYFDFLDDVLRPCGFIFLRRNVEDVLSSFRKELWFPDSSDDELRDMLTDFFQTCHAIATAKPDRSFELDYSELAPDNLRFVEMFGFFGLPFHAEEVRRRLAERCSY